MQTKDRNKDLRNHIIRQDLNQWLVNKLFLYPLSCGVMAMFEITISHDKLSMNTPVDNALDLVKQ